VHAAFTLPGLGVVIDEARVIERSRSVTDWRNPVWRHDDGSVAEGDCGESGRRSLAGLRKVIFI